MNRGRKRLAQLERSISGRITRQARREDTIAPAIEARRRHFHLGRARAGDPAMSSTLGRLQAFGFISEAQLAVGLGFQSLVRAWVDQAEAPRPVPRAAAASPGGGSPVRELLQDPGREEALHGRALAVLGALEPGPREIVWAVCIAETDNRLTNAEIGELRSGLNAILRALQK